MYEIKKGIPITKSEYTSKQQSLYPFGFMEIGDCFDVPVAEQQKKQRQNLSGHTSMYSRRHPAYAFITRRVADENVIRVWRVEPKQKDPQ